MRWQEGQGEQSQKPHDQIQSRRHELLGLRVIQAKNIVDIPRPFRVGQDCARRRQQKKGDDPVNTPPPAFGLAGRTALVTQLIINKS